MNMSRLAFLADIEILTQRETIKSISLYLWNNIAHIINDDKIS